MKILVRLRKIIILFILPFGFIILLPHFCYSQKPKSAEKQQQEFLKKDEQRKKDAEKQKVKDLKKHEKSQDKSTQKRMKESRKKAERVRANRKDPFLKRLFVKKR
jgi:Flp pilus assembly protein TadB